MQLTKLAISKFFSKPSKITKLCILSLVIFLCWHHSASAARWIDNAQESFNVLGPTFNVPNGDRPIDPRQFIANLLKIILGFLAVLATILILYAGFSWMTAAGNDKKIKTATDTLQAAVIGLLLILAALSITVFVSNAILGSTGTQATQIRQSFR